MLVTLIVAFALVVGRLAVVQGVSANHYAALGVQQRLRLIPLAADRGSIFDRAGNELAMSVPQSTIWADPRLISDPAGSARALADVLGSDANAVEARLTKKEGFVYLARKVDDATAAKVKALKLKGIFFVPEAKRFDPAGSLAAPVVGSAGADNQGLSGLEVGYDKLLSGTPGKLVVEQDPTGKDLPGGYHRLTPSARGSDLVLTLDRSIQYEAEQDLAAEIVAARAVGGMAAVMDTHSGEILAMASLKAGTAPGQAPQPTANNEVVTKVFEPGSILKLATISGALEEGLIKPGDVATVPDHRKVADGNFFDDTNHPDRQWSVTDILTASSNVGTIGIGLKLGKEHIDSYLRNYGFGSRTGLGLPGESPGLLPDPKNWSATSIATIPIGQGVAVTAVQLLAAYNTIANGGVYVAPKLVKDVIDPSGKTVSTAPSPTHRVVSPKTAQEMTAMFSEVVRAGTATAARIDGYTVAGKTGTARKVIGGRYADGKYFSDFGGFVPAERPAFTALVVLDEPTPIFGGLVAAPVFAQVARYGLRQLQVPPPPGDPHLFDDVPHASPTAGTVAAAAGGSADAAVATPGSTGAGAPSTTGAAAPAASPAPPPAVVPATPRPTPKPGPPPSTSTTVARRPVSAGPQLGPPPGPNGHQGTPATTPPTTIGQRAILTRAQTTAAPP